jgi:hypothetical protein
MKYKLCCFRHKLTVNNHVKMPHTNLRCKRLNYTLIPANRIYAYISCIKHSIYLVIATLVLSQKSELIRTPVIVHNSFINMFASNFNFYYFFIVRFTTVTYIFFAVFLIIKRQNKFFYHSHLLS